MELMRQVAPSTKKGLTPPPRESENSSACDVLAGTLYEMWFAHVLSDLEGSERQQQR